MKFPLPLPVSELAEQIGAELLGDSDLLATGINEVHHVEEGDITFVDVEKYYAKALGSAATIILINKAAEVPAGKVLLVVDDPFTTYNDLVWRYRPLQPLQRSIASSALIGEGTTIEPGAVIGEQAVVGKNCYIHANAYIGDHSVLGDEVVVQTGAVIGSDAFYFKKTAAGFHKWRSGGRVVLEDRVDIGANCTINKGVSSDTIIGAGSKLDCQVQIGHDTKVGKKCLFAAQVGIAGNCTIGNEVVIYGQAGIAQNVTIGDKAIVSAKAGVSKDLEGGKLYFGVPAQEARDAYRELAALRQLPDFLRKNK
ncbi:UDP-3-O-(3-hydroxymyristoyl)glucosamine N-acyltransferase [Lewinella cohaerens]|uniref:UDP-3-O-(3-hydroxymyristoyl)glucosamine N-acyltransferase n=1 Tax=Lewinella cohaerens TaxID=70995 RepID=UPI00037D10D2|nr:UDP-3-O-(3-hydroxymyristoyl)glucosamine N-acyltransferase [Lewinella cohaerens]